MTLTYLTDDVSDGARGHFLHADNRSYTGFDLDLI